MEDKKVIIVTGANSGVGLEAAKGLCELGHDVIVSVRDEVKGEATITEIKSKVPEAKVMYLIMELSDPQSIRDFVDKFHATGKSLNVLLNNAGVMRTVSSSERVSARDDPNLELMMTVNCMGTFLLTNLLLDDLKSSATEASPSRIVNVSSSATVRKLFAPQVGFYIDDLMLVKEGNYLNDIQAYRNSKLALNLWSRELADTLKEHHVTLNTVCPGFIPTTNLNRQDRASFSIGSIILAISKTFIGRLFLSAVPVSEGQRRLIRLAVGEDVKDTGMFYTDDKVTKEAPEVLDKDNQGKIWDLCVKYSGL